MQPIAPYSPSPPDRLRAVGGRATDATLAAVTHAAILFGLFGVGFVITLAINGGIWLYSRRSPFVAYHAQQAGCYQCFVVVVNILYLALGGTLLGVAAVYPQWGFVGPLLFVVAVTGVVWFVLSILYGVWAAVRVLLGRPFAYPVFGRLAARDK